MGYWELVSTNNQIMRCTLASSSKTLGAFYFLHFHSQTGSFNIVVANDSMLRDEWRKLRCNVENIYTTNSIG